jgi:hypothetical protein
MFRKLVVLETEIRYSMNMISNYFRRSFMMKKKLIATIFFMFIVVMVGCNSDGEKPETSNGNESVTYDVAAFDISLPDISGNLVSVSPDGKTIYAYFTGVN